MLGAMIVGSFYLYIWLAITVVRKVYEKTQSLTKKRIVIAIFVLIPTWDIILGYPIYAYLCATQAGIKIYKTVDNVEGFYVGENPNGQSILLPHEGYRFIDYKDQKDGKYYRNSWLDNNTSSECVSYDGAWSSEYTQVFKSGKCIIKEELKESEVSRWEEGDNVNGYTTIIPDYIDRWNARIMDRQTRKPLAELISYSYSVGWVWGIISSIETGNRSWEKCSLDGSYQDMFAKTLKIKQGVSHGNN